MIETILFSKYLLLTSIFYLLIITVNLKIIIIIIIITPPFWLFSICFPPLFPWCGCAALPPSFSLFIFRFFFFFTWRCSFSIFSLSQIKGYIYTLPIMTKLPTWAPLPFAFSSEGNHWALIFFWLVRLRDTVTMGLLYLTKT